MKWLGAQCEGARLTEYFKRFGQVCVIGVQEATFSWLRRSALGGGHCEGRLRVYIYLS